MIIIIIIKAKEILKIRKFFYNADKYILLYPTMILDTPIIPAVSIQNIDKYLDGKQVLFDVNLSIGKGEVF